MDKEPNCILMAGKNSYNNNNTSKTITRYLTTAEQLSLLIQCQFNFNCSPFVILTAKSVQGAALTFQRVDDVHGRHRLPLGVLRVRYGVTDDVFQEDF